MNKLKLIFAFLLYLTLTGACTKKTEIVVPPYIPPVIADTFYIRSVDASMLPQVRESGVVTLNRSGVAEDMLKTLKNAGVNTIRLRLWHSPADGRSGLAEVKTLAEETRNMGMKVWLTVHYSDTWADPGNQTKPEAWSLLNFEQLTDSVFGYTSRIVAAVRPDYIQIGNEINNGLLWPEGSLSHTSQLLKLLSEGIRAVRENDARTQIILHVAGLDHALFLFQQFNGLNYDLAAISYYPLWHGKDVGMLHQVISGITFAQNKKVLIAETSYPFTFGWNDFTNNIIGSNDQILPRFPATPEGQKNYLNFIDSLVTSRSGAGFSYWGADWISFKGPQATDGSSWENQALWDFNGRALPALDAFRK